MTFDYYLVSKTLTMFGVVMLKGIPGMLRQLILLRFSTVGELRYSDHRIANSLVFFTEYSRH